MSKFAITTDMAADLPEGYFNSEQIDVLPMPFTVGDTDYYNASLPTYHEFYDFLRAGQIATTSQTSIYDAVKVFEKHLEAGEDILHICFSSGMSGSYSSLSLATHDLERRFKGRSIKILDSLSGCGGQGLMVRDAIALRKTGKSLEEVFNILDREKKHYNHFFIVEDLNNLYRGGRLTRLEATVGTLLGIKPLLELNHSGKIMPLIKIMGKKKAISSLAEQVHKFYKPATDSLIIVEHGDDIQNAELLAAKIRDFFPNAQIEYAYVNYLVGAHAGPGSLAVFFKGALRPHAIPIPSRKES